MAAEWMRSEKRKLFPGDRQFEVAGEVRTFEVSVDNGAVFEVDCAVVRVWCQKIQKYVALAITEQGLVLGQSKQHKYEECLSDLRETWQLGGSNPATWMDAEGRKLFPGDRQFEIAGEVRTFELTLNNDAVLAIDCAVVRVWCQKIQKFLVVAITEQGLVLGQAKQGTYKQCLSELREQIEA